MIGRLIPTAHHHGTGNCALGLHSASLSTSRAHLSDPAMLACLSPPPPAASPLATPTASSSSPAVACSTPSFLPYPSSSFSSSSLPLYSPYSSSTFTPARSAPLSSPLAHQLAHRSSRAAASINSTSRSASAAARRSFYSRASINGGLSASLHGGSSSSARWSRGCSGTAGGARGGCRGVGDRRRGVAAGAASATALVAADGGGGGDGEGGRLKGAVAAAAAVGNGMGGSLVWREGSGEGSGEGAEGRGEAADGGVVGLLQQLPLRKCLVWAGVAGLVIQLREFLGIMMGTYVLSVVANAAVEGAQRVLPAQRRLLVALLYAFALAALLALGFAYLPPLYNTATQLILNIQRRLLVALLYAFALAALLALGFAYLPPLYNTATQLILNIQGEDAYSWIATRMRAEFGDTFTEQLERYMLLMMSPPTTQGIMGVGGAPVAMAAHPSAALRQVFKKYAGSMLALLATAFAATGRFLLKSLVSLILSAMIVWDLPSLARGMQSLQTSRFAPIYDELAPVVLTFGRIFCRALEAQSLIAVVNTALTFLGMMLLNIHGILVLSAVVFVFSFVPVAGVVISTVPMGLVALSEGGVVKVVLVVLMVVLMHALEAYILNPAIYSAHLKLHPILTLAVLLVAEHAMGVWGLLVAVPLTVFIVKHIIHTNPLASLDGLSESSSSSPSASPSLSSKASSLSSASSSSSPSPPAPAAGSPAQSKGRSDDSPSPDHSPA
ncbi:hypothetical protein CLOM_g19862 [Closterium sp. NIES-68]|nr:hypothetical protein CLOM_g19862 [Closterium sp. NIES-68]